MQKEKIIKELIHKIYMTAEIKRIKVFLSSRYPLFSAIGMLILRQHYHINDNDKPLIWIDSE